MKFIPYHQLAKTPNIVVDGEAQQGTLLTLSHWPKSGTPWPLKGDLSAQIVFNYLDKPEFQISAEAASNNHYDEDGVVSLYGLLNPAKALAQRDFLIDIASAGDFNRFHNPKALRVAMEIQALADEELSSLPKETFSLPYPALCGKLYEAALGLFEGWMESPKAGAKEVEAYENGRQAMASGLVTLRQVEALDLAIFEFDHAIEMTGFSPYALHNTTPCGAILTRQGSRYHFYYRYETWVQFVSRPIRARRDLTALATRLSQADGASWEFGGVENGAPALERADQGDSKIEFDEFLNLLEGEMAALPAAWDPLDSK